MTRAFPPAGAGRSSASQTAGPGQFRHCRRSAHKCTYTHRTADVRASKAWLYVRTYTYVRMYVRACVRACVCACVLMFHTACGIRVKSLRPGSTTSTVTSRREGSAFVSLWMCAGRLTKAPCTNRRIRSKRALMSDDVRRLQGSEAGYAAMLAASHETRNQTQPSQTDASFLSFGF